MNSVFRETEDVKVKPLLGNTLKIQLSVTFTKGRIIFIQIPNCLLSIKTMIYNNDYKSLSTVFHDSHVNHQRYEAVPLFF